MSLVFFLVILRMRYRISLIVYFRNKRDLNIVNIFIIIFGVKLG